jgi:hypothetical protein
VACAQALDLAPVARAVGLVPERELLADLLEVAAAEAVAALGRPGLERGRNPRGWNADVRYMPSSENRSHGATLGDRLEPFCNGTRFRYVFR